jgi:hypothetical protein
MKKDFFPPSSPLLIGQRRKGLRKGLKRKAGKKGLKNRHENKRRVR